MDTGQPVVLLVDDNTDLLTATSFMVSLLGKMRVVTAVDGVDGLEKAREWHPDCIITDIQMPRMNGYELIQEIRNDPTVTHIPIILFSAFIDETGGEMLQDGVRYLAKPVMPQTLIATIRASLR